MSISDEDKKNIDGLYGLNYGEKILYGWHTLYTSYTGHFGTRYLPKVLFIPEFEHFENPYGSYVSVYEDKNISGKGIPGRDISWVVFQFFFCLYFHNPVWLHGFVRKEKPSRSLFSPLIVRFRPRMIFS